MKQARREILHPASRAAWRRQVLHRFLALTAIPVAVLATLEIGLRVACFGFVADFLIPVDHGLEATNPRFGWRFFPRHVARTPVVEAVPSPKQEGTVRIFVLGGSAAMGTPQPAFSFGRILGSMLEERHPHLRFEVFNAAMAAISSHVVLEIAREVLARDPDLLLVYTGNNEVVGPFGPGTVFRSFEAQRSAIRASVFVQKWRLGQLLNRGVTALAGGDEISRWRGMEMFLDQQVAASDPRLADVYEHLERNLVAMAGAAHRSGVGVVFSTPATNLHGFPPFASRHREDLTAAELGRWQRHYDRGRSAADADPVAAEAAWRRALAIDAGHAELRYRLGLLLLAQGRREEASAELEVARDLDTLRFRADSRIQGTIRRVARSAGTHVVLVDAAGELGALPEDDAGEELFWEHVHLRFLGNYRLAELFVPPAEALVPMLAVSPTPNAMPGPEDVARRLARTPRDRLVSAQSMLRMMKRPPFRGQTGNDDRLDALRREIRELRIQVYVDRDRARLVYEEAVSRHPDDLRLLERHAELLESRGQHRAAVDVWRKLVERVPTAPGWRGRLGLALAAAGEDAAAERELRRVTQSFPEDLQAWVNLGTVLEQGGRIAEAEDLFRRIARRRHAVSARINLARLLEITDRSDQALAEYRALLAEDPESDEVQRRFAETLDRLGRDTEAIDAYRTVLALNPDDAATHSNLGLALERQGWPAEALEAFQAGLDVDPTSATAYFNLGDLLLSYGDVAQAVPAYRAGLELEPGNQQARANLAQALSLLGEVPSLEGG